MEVNGFIRGIGLSTGNLKKVVNVIELLLKTERSEYLIAYEEAKTRLPRCCAVAALANLQVFISPFALKLIRKQLDKLMRVKNFPDEALPACNKTYRLTMGLPCAHDIERRVNNEELIQLEDVHPHWRIYGIDETLNRRASEHDSESGQPNARQDEDARDAGDAEMEDEVSKNAGDAEMEDENSKNNDVEAVENLRVTGNQRN